MPDDAPDTSPGATDAAQRAIYDLARARDWRVDLTDAADRRAVAEAVLGSSTPPSTRRSRTVSDSEHERLYKIVTDLAPELVEEGADHFDGYFVHWDQVIEAVSQAWPDTMVGYAESPMELVSRLIDERDALAAALAASEAERYALYRLHDGAPVAQVAHIPPADFVRTRFVRVEEFNDALAASEARIAEAERERDGLREQKDGAYAERNQCVALIARLALANGWKAGTAKTAIEGWSDDWHGCVYIELPTGQVSWHFHDSQAWMFADLPPYAGAWDGHDTPEKYRRVNTALLSPAPADVRVYDRVLSAAEVADIYRRDDTPTEEWRTVSAEEAMGLAVGTWVRVKRPFKMNVGSPQEFEGEVTDVLDYLIVFCTDGKERGAYPGRDTLAVRVPATAAGEGAEEATK
ncbi:MAG TPA: hypothetical protein VEA69_16890 [Tepidisphaeraceae bacterium]|nr:hypothetical protein [Tepidisphaeraceae bacterium]